jgi:hypothetical protein
MKSKTALLLSLLIPCSIMVSCVKWLEPPADGLELYYTFDRNLDDLSGNNNDGINYTSNNYVKGRWAQALDFNGTSDFIQISNTLNAENGLSFSFWIKSRGATGMENNGAIVSKYNMTAHLRCFMIYTFGAYETRNDNRLSAAFYKYQNSSAIHDNIKSYLDVNDLNPFPDPSLWTIIKPKRIETGTWTHCVINVTSTEIQAWLNGELCAKKRREYTTYFDSPAEPTFIGNNLAIGEGNNNHFNGALDELRIFSRGLSEREIKILFKNK